MILDLADRVLADGSDERFWLDQRVRCLTASDAKAWKREKSIDTYVGYKINPQRSFYGTKYTRSGKQWEPLILAQSGIAQNKALIHAPGQPRFAATPDGLHVLPSREPVTVEVKVRHEYVATGPDKSEQQQIQWQMACMGPQFRRCIFIEAEIDPDSHLHRIVKRFVERDDELIDRLVNVYANPILARWDEIERTTA